MARRSGGEEVLEKAKGFLSKVRTAAELRQVLAVVMPLELGLSIEQTAAVLGVSKGWACRLRTQVIRSEGRCFENETPRGGRRRENMSRKEEAEFLEPFFDKAAKGGVLVVGEIKRALDKKLGRRVALASAYNLLHRHGWRKLAPDKRHPKADVKLQEDWKKNFPS